MGAEFLLCPLCQPTGGQGVPLCATYLLQGGHKSSRENKHRGLLNTQSVPQRQVSLTTSVPSRCSTGICPSKTRRWAGAMLGIQLRPHALHHLHADLSWAQPSVCRAGWGRGQSYGSHKDASDAPEVEREQKGSQGSRAARSKYGSTMCIFSKSSRPMFPQRVSRFPE